MIIDRFEIQSEVIRALQEDIGSGDVTANLLPTDLIVEAEIIAREPLLVCGIEWVDMVFNALNPWIAINWLVKEGDWLETPSVLCEIEGSAHHILKGERTALNFLQTLSATATQTYRYVQQLKGTQARLLDTRKTIPGLRRAQKYAVACAGGKNHRLGLYDGYLIKENHIKACGSIASAVALAKSNNQSLLVEVEVENLHELQEALDAAPDRILLDNFTMDMLCEAVKIKGSSRCELEASGGINLTNILAIAETGVDYISVGAITKSIQAIDLSLLIRD